MLNNLRKLPTNTTYWKVTQKDCFHFLLPNSSESSPKPSFYKINTFQAYKKVPSLNYTIILHYFSWQEMIKMSAKSWGELSYIGVQCCTHGEHRFQKYPLNKFEFSSSFSKKTSLKQEFCIVSHQIWSPKLQRLKNKQTNKQTPTRKAHYAFYFQKKTPFHIL